MSPAPLWPWVPVYYFAGYAYSAPGPTIIPLGENPSSGNIEYVTCTTPPLEYWLFDGGSLGINADGTASPPTQFRACCHDSVCTVESEMSCLDMYGGVWLEETSACDPDPCTISACCVDEACMLRSELECLEAGGHWMELETACEPDNPCDKGACCLPAGCEFVWEDSCHVLHPEITGEFEPGEIWHPTGDCDPGTTLCYPNPVHETSWGAMKMLYLRSGK